MEVKFISFDGIKQYARVMYDDVKDSDKYKIDIAYNGRDIKDLLEYLFGLEEKIDKAKEFCKIFLNLGDIDSAKLLEKLLEILGDKENETN